MTFRITQPGEYKTRDGRKAVVEAKNWDHHATTHPWRGQIIGLGTVTWTDEGRWAAGRRDDGWDIIGPWETTNNTETNVTKQIDLTEFNQEIDASKAICAQGKKDVQKAVGKLVQLLGYEVKPSQPEVKAGQVWRLRYDHSPSVVPNNPNQNGFILLKEAGYSFLEGLNFHKELILRGGTFLANSMDEYYAKKAKGEV